MRTLAPAPARFIDESGRPHFGSFEGTLPRIEHASSTLARITKRKKWVYVALTSRDVWISIAVVRTGYAATAFAFAYDLSAKKMVEDVSVMGMSAVVNDDPHALGALATFSFGKTRIALTRNADLSMKARIGKIDVDVVLSDAARITAIADLGKGLFDATEKEAPMPARGEARIGERRFDLDGALGAVDYTHGLLPRHTQWRWAFGLGTQDGKPIGFNFVQGFVGEAECALFEGDRVVPLGEPQFAFGDPLEPWRLRGDGIDLRFVPGAMHAEYKNLVLIKSRFVQPVGTFTGTIGDRRIEGLPGVVEDQDVLW